MKKATKLWLKYAEEDSAAAKVSYEQRLWRAATFHSHQAAEKALKALWIEMGFGLERTHNLIRLLEKVKDRAKTISEKDVKFLTAVYIDTRYPIGSEVAEAIEITQDIATRAVKISESVVAEVRKILG